MAVVVSIGSEGVEPSSGTYKEPALTVELRAARYSESILSVGPEGVEPSPARLKVCCAAFTPRPRIPIRGVRFSRRAITSVLLMNQRGVARGGVEPPLPPYQSDMLPLQHRAGFQRGARNPERGTTGYNRFVPRSAFRVPRLQSGWPESNCAVSCSRRTRVAITLHPASQNGRIRTGGLLAPSQADFQALPRSDSRIARRGVEPRPPP